MGSDRTSRNLLLILTLFQSTLPAWGATFFGFDKRSVSRISIHAPRMGSDSIRITDASVNELFQSTLPAWGATFVPYRLLWKHWISIHAPRMGSDPRRKMLSLIPHYFNPRSPHGERPDAERYDILKAHFNPRSPHGERLYDGTVYDVSCISIHAPRMGSDGLLLSLRLAKCYFNPRSPHGERPFSSLGRSLCAYFNPRSPHGERQNAFDSLSSKIHFNPRSPHGERPSAGASSAIAAKFQSTLPAWGATFNVWCFCWWCLYFNPRSPHGERPIINCGSFCTANFNPRSPHGERRIRLIRFLLKLLFQSTLPAWGATSVDLSLPVIIDDFNPRSPHGERPAPIRAAPRRDIISIHAPRMGSDNCSQ